VPGCRKSSEHIQFLAACVYREIVAGRARNADTACFVMRAVWRPDCLATIKQRQPQLTFRSQQMCHLQQKIRRQHHDSFFILQQRPAAGSSTEG
jgi:hypothetical protein